MKFICDSMLGTLAKWLRIFGYDVLYNPAWKREELINISLREDRIILTRGTSLIKKIGLKVVHIEKDGLENQLKQLVKQLSLRLTESSIFERCTICNVICKTVKKEEVRDRVPAYVYQTQNEFRICPVCTRIYWPGTHIESVQKMIKTILKNE